MATAMTNRGALVAVCIPENQTSNTGELRGVGG